MPSSSANIQPAAPLAPTESPLPLPVRAISGQEPRPERLGPEPVWIWGLPLSGVATSQALDLVDDLIRRGQPSLFITANLHYAMLTDAHPALRAVNARAAFVLPDGMPMVWYSRCIGLALPERVAGSDLVYLLSERAAARGHRVFLLGGEPGVAQTAAKILADRYPDLQIVGTESPPLRTWTAEENAELIARIRSARPDLLLAALGQPKGELWLDEHCQQMGVPACVQVGASLDFVAGKARRAPKWTHRIGLEWAYRALSEPRRLGPRYIRNAAFLLKAVLRDARAWLGTRVGDRTASSPR